MDANTGDPEGEEYPRKFALDPR